MEGQKELKIKILYAFKILLFYFWSILSKIYYLCSLIYIIFHWKNMLNRHFLRSKVLQELYSVKINDSSNIDVHCKKLIDSFHSLNDLQVYLFAALLEIHKIANERIEENKQKMLPTESDLNPNMRFIENDFFKILIENKDLEKRINALKINFFEQRDVLKSIFNKFILSESYNNYMLSKTKSFANEKMIVVQLFKNYIISNEQFFDLICEHNLSWESDYDLMAQISLRKLREIDSELIFDNLEDLDLNFIESLFRNTIENDEEFTELIHSRVKNWDVERVALMDIIIIKMGISELIYCPEIPVNVTLNEYVELSKEFSTQKSKLFVNGLLDKLMIDLRAKGKIKKIEVDIDENELENEE